VYSGRRHTSEGSNLRRHQVRTQNLTWQLVAVSEIYLSMILCLCRSVECCFLLGVEAEGLQNVQGTCRKIFQPRILSKLVTPVEEYSKCLTYNWNIEIQRETNHQFWAIGLLKNTTSTPESIRAKMKGVMCS